MKVSDNEIAETDYLKAEQGKYEWVTKYWIIWNFDSKIMDQEQLEYLFLQL